MAKSDGVKVWLYIVLYFNLSLILRLTQIEYKSARYDVSNNYK